MATIQTAALIDGRWITRNVDIETVLRQNTKEEEDAQVKTAKPPRMGVLTQTVVESPVTHWILPMRLKRDANQNLAFIGDHLVRIFRLCNDGRIQEVARKVDFGSRIRNARIMESDKFGMTTQQTPPPESLTDDCGDMLMPTDSRDYHRPLPPECLVLSLESGHLVFLYARWLCSGLEFVIGRHLVSRPMLSEQPGKHMAIDPSSRYLAVACSEKFFAVYTLHTEDVLSSPQAPGHFFCPIQSERYFSVDGVIHQMEFVHPSPNDPDHMILLLMIIRRGSTRMQTFEWVAGQNLRNINSNNKNGHLVPQAFRMPLFLIPLSARSAMIMACKEAVVACEGLLEGSPRFRTLDISPVEPTALHIGRDTPLWTSWTKPMRFRAYRKSHDDFYLAREDGVIKFFEMDISEDDLLKVEMHAGDFKCNIGTAFTCLGQIGRANDILIAGGDAGDGGIYQIFAKQPAQLIAPISNCSPILDFVAIEQTDLSNKSLTSSIKSSEALGEPDRIFACSGKGSNGCITEIRYGCEARLRLAINELDVPIMGAWALPYYLPAEAHRYLVEGTPMLFLLSIGDRSLLLHLARHYQSIVEIPQSATWIDLSSRTLLAECYDGCTVQITERSIIVSTDAVLSLAQPSFSLRKESSAGETILAAAIHEHQLLMIAYSIPNGEVYLYLQRIVIVEGVPALHQIGDSIILLRCPHCLLIAKFGRSVHGLIGYSEPAGYEQDISLIDAYNLQEDSGFTNRCSMAWDRSQGTSMPDACVSMVVLSDLDKLDPNVQILLSGYRSGLLLATKIEITDEGSFVSRELFRGIVGMTPVALKSDTTCESAIICCDSKVFRFQYDKTQISSVSLRRIWFTDAARPSFNQPLFNHVTTLPDGLLLTAGKQLFISWFGTQVKDIPRSLPLDGSPTRVAYSPELNMLVVGTTSKRGSSLKFIDPDAVPFQSSNGHPLIDIPPTAGVPAGRVLCIVPWLWQRGKSRILVVGTSCGQLLLFRLAVPTRDPDWLENGWQITNDPHYQLFKQRFFEHPVSAVCGIEGSIFCCIGDNLLWFTLEQESGGLKRQALKQLPSRGVSVKLEGGSWLHVLTANHSVVSFVITPDQSLIPQFSDEIARSGLDQVLTHHSNGSDLIIASDKACSVVGFWGNQTKQRVARDHCLVFEAELPVSIVKFRYAKTRPPWDMSWRGSEPRGVIQGEYGRILLGGSIDGTITSFTVLSDSLLQLLAFVQDLTRESSEISPTNLDHIKFIDNSDPRRRHISGDILRRCLRPGYLQRLITGRAAVHERTGEHPAETFRALVQAWYGATSQGHDEGDTGDIAWCLQETHKLLSSLLRPVI